MFHRLLYILLALILMQTSVQADLISVKKNKTVELKNGQMNMLFKIDFREFDKDRILEFRFYDQPFVNITVLHDPGKNNPKFTSFSSKIVSLDKNQVAAVNKIHDQLKVLKFKNTFPWKENFNKRGDIYYIHSLQEYLPVSDSASKSISVSQVFIFYKGFKDEYPAVYGEIADLINGLQ
jgi:hypothetical protein